MSKFYNTIIKIFTWIFKVQIIKIVEVVNIQEEK